MSFAEQKIFEILKRVEKPARYLGGEVNAIVKDLSQVDLKVALVMPEPYEIAQSNLGIQILYEVLNKIPNVAAERVYAPWVDLERELRAASLPPFSLENKVPLSEFDIIGISLPYELSYTNILTMLDLARIPFYAKDRQGMLPLIIGGGNQAFNPEPIADFFDAFVIGDGEEVVVQIVEQVMRWKKKEAPLPAKAELLKEMTAIPGFYVPSFFEISYRSDETLEKIRPLFEDYSGVRKAIVQDLDQASFPTAPIVPSTKTVHDRLAIEVQRGCVRACRFCQAGYIYRPERQRSPEKVLELIEEGIKQTGSEEISLLSLSIGDYGCLLPLVRELFNRYEKKRVAISLPATRTDTFSPEVLGELKRVRKTGVTVAPEAGSPRLRRVINKGNSREDLYKTVEDIFGGGWNLVKFYYMCGLPFETLEDLAGIAEEGEAALQIGRKYTPRAKIHLSVSPHVPKPHTPFQWERQDSIEETRQKIHFIKTHLKNRGVEFKYHDPEQSYLEGVFARGDRRLSRVIEKAWRLGARYDGWDEHFNLKVWCDAFQEAGMNPDFYVTRERAYDEVLPWDHLFTDLKKEFLWNERLAAQKESFIPDCSTHRCADCGICDFKEIKNINYQFNVEKDSVLQFSTRGRKLAEYPKQGFSQPRQSQAIQDFSEAGSQTIQEEISSDAKVFGAQSSQWRCRYSKTGSIAFISHLELVGVFRRALARAQIPLKFSEGYHPQPRIAFSQPIPVGAESLSEFFDLEVEGEIDPLKFPSLLNRFLPSGLQVLSCEKNPPKISSLSAGIVGSVWEVELSSSFPGGKEILDQKIQTLAAKESIVITRKRENENRKIDIRPFIGGIEALSDRSMRVVTRALPQGTTRPQEVVSELFKDLPDQKVFIQKMMKTDSLFDSSQV